VSDTVTNSSMEIPRKIQYTGLNESEVRRFVGEGNILAPYFCMGFSMLTLKTDEGYVSVNEGDWICRDASGKLSVSYDGTIQEMLSESNNELR
ncbi:MAG: hypothetical protein Q4F70_06290, partial [Clostridia bacterium]|nr:hypothetical protein [Clostridia bacterium]